MPRRTRPACINEAADRADQFTRFLDAKINKAKLMADPDFDDVEPETGVMSPVPPDVRNEPDDGKHQN